MDSTHRGVNCFAPLLADADFGPQCSPDREQRWQDRCIEMLGNPLSLSDTMDCAHEELPIDIGREMLFIRLAGLSATVFPLVFDALQNGGNPGRVTFWHPNSELVPVRPRWRQPVVGDDDRREAGLEHLKQPDA